MRAVIGALTIVLLILQANAVLAQSPDLLGDAAVGDVDSPVEPESAGVCVGARCSAEVAVDVGVGGDGGRADPCTYVVGDYEDALDQVRAQLVTDPATRGGPAPAPGVHDRQWVVVYCPSSSLTETSALWGVFQLGEPPTPEVVARVAEQAIVLPVPEPTFSPGADDFQVIGLDTWVWLDEAQTGTTVATACLPPADYACVEVTGQFDHLAADMGDDSEPLACAGPGRAYDTAQAYLDQRELPHCGHVYTSAPGEGSTYPVVVTTTWQVSYTCRYDADLDGIHDAGCGGGDLGLVARSGAPQPLEVRDLQAVGTR